ncbi:MAG: hypothetical protein HY042_03975, partial [Spirochaetia bacterium]|nr:hypothetical protein [Spirochaetia bacterium]
MAQKKQSVNLSELRGNDRVFQIDRDTVIIFAGRDRRDLRPFVRVGSGAAIPHNLLRHIENVILPDSDPPNAALEVAWIQATVADGNDVIRYVGSKDTISQMYYYSGIAELREDQKPQIELIPYAQGKGVQDARGRSVTTLYGNGNFSVSVGGSRVLDFQNFRTFAVSAPGGDKLNNLKKLYLNAKLAFFEDGRSLPFAREASYFTSKTKSHGAFVVRMGGNVESHVQVLFPLSTGSRKNKSFEYIRGPYDLEVAHISHKTDFDDVQGRLVLHIPHGISQGYYMGRSLRPGSYPLAAGAEYNLHHGDAPASLVKAFLEALKGTPFEALVQDFLMQCLSGEADADKASKKNSLARFTNRQWMALAEAGAHSFEILSLAGKRTYLLAQKKAPEVVVFQMPPAVENLQAEGQAYKGLLRRQGRLLDKANDPPGYRGCIEAIEKILEERYRLLHERQRLFDLLGALDIGLHAPRKNAAAGIKDRLTAWIGSSKSGVKRGIQFVRDNLMLMTDRVRSLKAASLLIVAGIAVVLAMWGLTAGVRALAGTFGLRGGSSLSQDAAGNKGNRGPALEAAVLAHPGEIQEDTVVVGESDIAADATEIYDYANALAVSNG